uniref:cellulase family glycosylhydrolase n=1 Tax=Pricia sp. TaxID=2268138 RepID=UPI0035948C83
MKIRYLISGLVLSLISFQACNTKDKNNGKAVENTVAKYQWQRYRGVNVACTIQEEDVKDLAKSGANLMRLAMPICTFIEMEEPYGYNELAFKKFDSVLDWGEKYGVNVLIDPHRYPGTGHQWT